MVTKRWVTSIDLELEDEALPTQKVLVDYEKLPMRCKACHSWKHRIRDCNEIQKKYVRGGRRPTHAQHTNKKKGKLLLLMKASNKSKIDKIKEGTFLMM